MRRAKIIMYNAFFSEPSPFARRSRRSHKSIAGVFLARSHEFFRRVSKSVLQCHDGSRFGTSIAPTFQSILLVEATKIRVEATKVFQEFFGALARILSSRFEECTSVPRWQQVWNFDCAEVLVHTAPPVRVEALCVF